MKTEDIKLGIYEKALPYGTDWTEKLATLLRIKRELMFPRP